MSSLFNKAVSPAVSQFTSLADGLAHTIKSSSVSTEGAISVMRSYRDLINDCLKGEPDAWGEFVSLFQPPISRAIAKVLKEHRLYSKALIDDLTQNTFVKLCDKELLR